MDNIRGTDSSKNISKKMRGNYLCWLVMLSTQHYFEYRKFPTPVIIYQGITTK